VAGGRGPRWTLFLTNRSFIAQVVALIFALLEIFGVFLPIDAADMAEIIGLAGYLVAQGWSVWERLRGKTRGIWNGDQARKALEEADALSKALRDAGAR
jgi:protein-S-isoprenylcysteine O-methyltransferase Ste14